MKSRIVILPLIGLLFLVAGCVGTPSQQRTAPSEPVMRVAPEPKTTVASPPQERAATESRPWYSGGSLHNAKMSEWSRSSYANRLATSADFVTKLMQMDGIKIPPVDQLKPQAQKLERNISAANTDGVADSQDVATIAATCWILMKK